MRGFRLAPLLAAALLSGCAAGVTGSITPDGDMNPPPGDTIPPGDTTPPPDDGKTPVVEQETLMLRGHFLARDGGYDPGVGVTDRTGQAIGVTATVTATDGVLTSVDVTADAPGKLDGGQQIPGLTNLTYSENPFPAFRSGSNDGFLTEVSFNTESFAAVRYNVSDGATKIVGFVAGGDPTATGNMPTQTTATYSGGANIHAVAGLAGAADLWGNLNLSATFNPDPVQNVVGGKISSIKSVADQAAVPLDMLLNPAAITGNTFSGGTVSIVDAGTNTPNGVVQSSNHSGGFFGLGAEEAGGTFHIRATGVNVPAFGGVQDIEAIGAFGGSKNP